jgi:two-component system, OmpR family, heavy metal sensor histidine kinase CusS
MTTRLALHYTLSVLILLTAASGFLYWELDRSLAKEHRDYIEHKIQVLTLILRKQPLDFAGLEQEVRDEAEVSAHSQSPFLLRVLDGSQQLIAETPGMDSLLPMSVFPPSRSAAMRDRSWQSASGKDFLLASVSVPAVIPNLGWDIQVAVETSAERELLNRYRRDIAVVLGAGVALAAAIGAWIARRGLRPLADITRATERIGAQQLQERILPRSWPKELASLAAAFDRMLDRLQEAFERLSRFSADLAHELRTPINNLMGETQVALSRERTTDEYRALLQSALEEHGRLARMIDSMLFLAQADQARTTLAPSVLDARTELEAVADFYRALAEEQGVELHCDGQGNIAADPLLVRRALSNLLSNALKYTPRGGRVTLRIVEPPDGVRTLSVIDSGVGIAAEHLPKLGDRFYRVDPSRTESARGAGLGLAIVRSIMTLHGGTLRIQSRPGAGTTASLEFPAEKLYMA